MKKAVLVGVLIALVAGAVGIGAYVYYASKKDSGDPASQVASAKVPKVANPSPQTSSALRVPSVKMPSTSSTAAGEESTAEEPQTPEIAGQNSQEPPAAVLTGQNVQEPQAPEKVKPGPSFLVELQDQEALAKAIEQFKELEFEYPKDALTDIKPGGEDKEYRPFCLVVQEKYSDKPKYLKKDYWGGGINFLIGEDYPAIFAYDESFVLYDSTGPNTLRNTKLLPIFNENSDTFKLERREEGYDTGRYFTTASGQRPGFEIWNGIIEHFKAQLASLASILHTKAPISFKLSKDGKPISSLQGEQTGGEREVWVYYGETIRPALDLSKAVTFRNLDGKIHVGLEPVGQGKQKLDVFERNGSVCFWLSMAGIGTVALDYQADSFVAIPNVKSPNLPYVFGLDHLKLLTSKALGKARNPNKRD